MFAFASCNAAPLVYLAYAAPRSALHGILASCLSSVSSPALFLYHYYHLSHHFYGATHLRVTCLPAFYTGHAISRTFITHICVLRLPRLSSPFRQFGDIPFALDTPLPPASPAQVISYAPCAMGNWILWDGAAHCAAKLAATAHAHRRTALRTRAPRTTAPLPLPPLPAAWDSGSLQGGRAGNTPMQGLGAPACEKARASPGGGDNISPAVNVEEAYTAGGRRNSLCALSWHLCAINIAT